MRMNQVAFSADVQQMFHRMQICLRDQQCQRVLWRESLDKPMNTMILNAMAFGPNCSPFVSQFVKNWNADNWSTAYPEAAKTIKKLMYMDDLISSESSVEKAVQIANQCIEICQHIKWNLISFQSNSIEFLKQLPGDHVKKDLIPILQDKDGEYTTKILGCNWNTTEDCFVFHLDRNIFVKIVKDFNHKPTKRDLASTIARIYDVLGLIAHFVIRGKILLQRSWKLKLDWNDEIPTDLQNQWISWLDDVEQITKLKIPRKYSELDDLKSADKIQLHVFCDAGAEAFGCCAYLVVHYNGNFTSRLVMAKAKVTPLCYKTETEIKEIPRLELMSALIAARLSNTISKSFKDIIMEKFFWSDSEIVLRWILNPNHRLIKFAISPIEEILEYTERNQWRYVPTMLNPADICTKFKKFDFSDNKSAWFIGPKFLCETGQQWPMLPEKLHIDNYAIVQNLYMRKLNYSTHNLPAIDCPLADDSFIDRLSPAIQAKWTKLRRAVARALKFYLDGIIPLIETGQFNNKVLRLELRNLNQNFRSLHPDDLERAEQFIFRKIQREAYPVEYAALKKNKPIKNREFLELSVFMDQQGLLRINSRVNLNDLNYPQQFVPVLPKGSDLVDALLQFYHEKYKHIALESQIAEVRTKCWITHVRRALQNIKTKCNECQLRNAKPYDPEMAPLPEFRINPTQQPFEITGLDCMGPIVVKCNNNYKKILILIFACTLTRFIHLHILESLESLRVLEAIVLFWSAHGPVRKFVSDNGTNFVGAARIIKEDHENAQLFLHQQQSKLMPKLSEIYQVDWDFIPPHSPWMAGFYERLIKEVKRSIVDTLDKRKINKIELNIGIQEAAHRINLRPLTHNSISADDDIILTPHHLAKLRSGWPLLPGLHKGQYASIDDQSIYRKGRNLADQIMAKFISYYLPVLTKKCKWFKEKPEVKLDDLVLLINPNETRKEWARGRVIKIHRGRDGKGRVADVQLKDGVIRRNRAVRNLAKIDIQI